MSIDKESVFRKENIFYSYLSTLVLPAVFLFLCVLFSSFFSFFLFFCQYIDSFFFFFKGHILNKSFFFFHLDTFFFKCSPFLTCRFFALDFFFLNVIVSFLCLIFVYILFVFWFFFLYLFQFFCISLPSAFSVPFVKFLFAWCHHVQY